MNKSASLFQRAKNHIPGGVNSPVRAFNSVGGTPPFIAKAYGPYVQDVDGNEYVDYVGSWGPMILGHAHPKVINAVQKAAENGLSFGAPTELEIQLADLICEIMPNIDMVRMVNSGTEATMSALRLARGYTGRDKIIKFAGCYHGHSDSLLVQAGSGCLTFGEPSSPGVPKNFAELTLTATYNDLDSVEQLFQQNSQQIAAIIVEPIAGNMNCVPPQPGFLQGLRQLCDQHEAILIFDEVMTGFRVALGGAQQLYSIKPDLTTLGKIIGGGMPVGAFGGKKEIMEKLSPLGPVYQAGTLSGNPIAMTAGLLNLQLISQPNFYQKLDEYSEKLFAQVQGLAKQHHIALTINRIGSMFGLFFTDQQHITNLADVSRCNTQQFNHFFHGMLQQGVYLAPSSYEAGFVSAAHGEREMAKTLAAFDKVFSQL